MPQLHSDPDSLKLAFPELHFSLECDQLRMMLCDRMKLQAYVNQIELRALAGIQLNDGYEILLRPTAPGFNGVKNWYKWRTFEDSRTGEIVRHSQLRCELELLHRVTGEEGEDVYIEVISFGMDAANTQDLIKKSLEKIYEYCSLRLVALPIVEVKQPNK
jgi:hypothetical protein